MVLISFFDMANLAPPDGGINDRKWAITVLPRLLAASGREYRSLEQRFTGIRDYTFASTSWVNTDFSYDG